MSELRSEIMKALIGFPPETVTEAEQIVDRVIALIQKEQGWRDDIESAPRDGTRILLSHGKPVKNAPRYAYLGKYLKKYDAWLLDSGVPISTDKFRYWMPIEPLPPTPPQGEDG